MITPTGSLTEYTIHTANSQPDGITPDPNGDIWFTENASNKIGVYRTEQSCNQIGKIIKCFTIRVFQEYPIPTANSKPTGIMYNPADGNLWFTEEGADKVGRITTSGTITEFAVPAGSAPNDIIMDGVGDPCFTEFTGNAIGCISLDSYYFGQYFDVETLPNADSGPYSITLFNGNLFWTESSGNRIGAAYSLLG